jgi:hypothetical protein
MKPSTVEPIVAVVRTRPETVLADHARLLDLAGLGSGAAAAGPLVLCLDREPGPAAGHPGAACAPWQLEGVARALQSAGRPAGEVTARTSGTPGLRQEPERTWQQVLERCGLGPLAARTTAATRDPAARLLLAGLRTRRWLGVTGSLQVLAADLLEPAALADLDRRPAALIDAWRRLGAGAVAGAVLDATVCSDGDVPSGWTPVQAHLLLAGKDPVAVDATAARLAGFEPWRLPLLSAAHAAGLGCADLARIALVGDRVDRLPSLGLQAAARYRGPRPAVLPGWRRWLANLQGWSPPTGLHVRRQRRRHESSPWARLHRQYRRPGEGQGDLG